MRLPLPFGDKLKDELGAPRRARKLGSSPRSRVWRVELAGGTAVVKQLVDGPEAGDRYAREVAALRLAARVVDPPVTAALLATDPGERVLVLEDVRHLEHREAGESWTVAYAAALARLHAATGADDTGRLPAWQGPGRTDIDSFLGLARTLGVTEPPFVREELEGLVDRLSGAPGHALLHGDPCPGNDLHTDTGVRFIDFEQASLGDARVELAYLRAGFPTCWCATAPRPDVLDEAETAYRTAWRDATGTEAADDLTDACAGWLLRGDALVQRAQRRTLDHLARLPGEDWTWGTAGARQRLVHRLELVRRMASGGGSTAAGGKLAAFGRLAGAVRERMLDRWPQLQPLPSHRPLVP